jgi:hypothetical protein
MERKEGRTYERGQVSNQQRWECLGRRDPERGELALVIGPRSKRASDGRGLDTDKTLTESRTASASSQSGLYLSYA